MKLIKLFIYSSGGILLAAALIRFLIAAGSAPVLSMPEPLLGLSIRYAVLLVGGFELTIALICLFARQSGLQLGCLAWAAINYLVYWIWIFMMHRHPQTTCIGSLTDPLQLSRGNMGLVLRSIPLYLLFGSCAAMFWIWRAARQAKAAKFHKMSCPACGVHIRFDDRNLGQKISCPQCRAAITLRKPDLLKMVCFFCQGHIKYPSHAIGEKMACPHCKMDITLKEPV
jgi:predicted RNA-binding Zn-ribbon protein involved in translation (DUF1610 family)